MKEEKKVQCPYCAAQGLTVNASSHDHRHETTVNPNTVRVGCPNGHIFATPKEKT